MISAFAETLAQNLRDARLRANMTQKQLAQRIGTTSNNISMYETGKRCPDLHRMSMLCDALGTKLDDIVPDATCYDDARELIDNMTIYELLEEES